jgi:3-hydroxyacyl-CoA dehydrogenase
MGRIASAAHADIALVRTAGFPRFRGGPMFQAAEWGLDRVVDRLGRLHASTGDPRWDAAPLLRTYARESRTIRP